VFKLTVQQYFRVNGASTQWRGVTPDIVLPDPTPFVESGERTLPHSIPWTSISALDYAREPHTWTIPALLAASRQRVQANQEFGRIENFGKVARERRKDTREPLQLERWRAERQRDKQVLEDLSPKQKDRKPLFRVEVVSDLFGPRGLAQDRKLRTRLDAWKDDLARDVWVDESLHVLADMAARR
jgi:carboxyl-terminal processing protease